MSANYERLSMEDAQYLAYEGPTSPMHVGGLMILERGPLVSEGGGIDIETFRKGIAAVLHKVPRFQQRIRWIPISNHPVWVDASEIDIRRHVRHASLPRPGTLAQLKDVIGRAMAQPLDRSRPLWEYWVIEGLEGDRFAVLTKIHHCVLDGVAGAGLAPVLMNVEPSWSYVEPPPFRPRPEPDDIDLVRDAALRTVGQPLEVLDRLASLWRDSDDPLESFQAGAGALGEALASTFQRATSPVAGELSSERLSDWRVMPVEALKAVRKASGATVNDIVLATVAGAFRRLFRNRGHEPAATPLRTMVPQNVRADGEENVGNKVSAWLVELPIDEPDPLERLERVRRATAKQKRRDPSLGTHLLLELAEYGPTALLSLTAWASSGVCDTFVTNVLAPQMPLYLFGARVLELIPQVPLAAGMGIAVGVISYDGRAHWGITADAHLVPDVSDFADALEASFAELERACGIAAGEGVL